jgi:hypothetical protein
VSMINVLNRQTFTIVGVCMLYICYVRTYCHIHCRVYNIAHKCRDDDCIEILAKANKICYYLIQI